VRIKTQVEELLRWLSFEELAALGVASDKLFADAGRDFFQPDGCRQAS
jgi:hypothetical protein